MTLPTLLAWMSMAIATAVAACCAASDGAMLALDPDVPMSAEMRGLYSRRERTHRALAYHRQSFQYRHFARLTPELAQQAIHQQHAPTIGQGVGNKAR